MTGIRTVIACGEHERGDDGAALDAATRLDPAVTDEVRIRLVRQLSPEELVDALEAGPVVLLDAVRGLTPGTVVELPLVGLCGTPPDWSATTHVLPIAAVVRLAAALGAPVELGWFVGVGGTSFEIGRGLSTPVRAALPRYVARIEERIAAVDR